MPVSPDDPTGPLPPASRPTQPMGLGQAQEPATAPAATRPLPAPEPAFGPLPEGALIGPYRYEVLAIRQDKQVPYLYLVQSRSPALICPNPECRAVVTDIAEGYCDSCGSDLSAATAFRPRYLAREALELDALGPEARLCQMQVSHPALDTPVECFLDDGPGGQPRAYAILREPSELAQNLPVPQPPALVAEWGGQLARGLAVLHQAGIWMRTVDPAHVRLDPQGAQWTDFSGAVLVEPEPVDPPAGQNSVRSGSAPDFASLIADDVRSLAGLLYSLMTGSQPTSDMAVPGPLMDVFQRAFGHEGNHKFPAPPGAPAGRKELGFATAADFARALEVALADLRRPSVVSIRSGRLTDVGQMRRLNEDSLVVLEIERVDQARHEQLGVYAVADGMGGHSAGEVASSLIVQAIQEQTTRWLLASPTGSAAQAADYNYTTWLKEAFQAANQLVLDQRQQRGTDMGSTLVMALVTGDTAYLGNVGDSRAYHLNHQRIQQVTVDHSLVQRLVDAGQITAEQARTHIQKNVIYRTIGERTRVETDLTTIRLAPGDRLVLCSDGLSGMIPDETIWRLVMAAQSPQDACRALVEAANQAGGEDNITVIVVQIDGG